MKIERKTGIALPLGALRTDDSPVIGEYTAITDFVAFSKKCGIKIVQLLPVLDTGVHSSPYSSLSAFALHPIYINVSKATAFQIVIESDAEAAKIYKEFLSLKNDSRFDYKKILFLKESLLKKIFRRLAYSSIPEIPDKCDLFHSFISQFSDWLPEYCVFKTLKELNAQKSWKEWEEKYRSLSKDEIRALWDNEELRELNFFYAWEQLIAFRQFSEAVAETRKMGVSLKGDIPILLNEDSCAVWARSDIFVKHGRAGSPPDGDNPTGQNWGFPIYDWKAQKKDDFAWWKRRLSVSERFFDAYRLDHLPGFFRFWTIKEEDKTAELGINLPNSPITAKMLSASGFSQERVKWLSEPHIPTADFFRLTGNIDKAHEILELCCNRIGHEELWNFKKSVKGNKTLLSLDLSKFNLDMQIQKEIILLLDFWWKNRALIEIRRDAFVPSNNFRNSRAWETLSFEEKEKLLTLFEQSWKKQNAEQEKQARTIFSSIIPFSKMIPCGENLGAYPPSLPSVMKDFGILSLNVVRWTRKWHEKYQPFVPLDLHEKRSVVTTSVHDSSTIRAWWENEKESVRAFVRDFLNEESNEKMRNAETLLLETPLSEQTFSPEIAEKIIAKCAKTNGDWFIPPLQDWLYLDKKYYATNPDDERINIPGTVSDFNWTWRLPATVSSLSSNEKLCSKIKKIATIHDSCEAD